MIAQGRSNLRAYIEDTGEYLSFLLDMYPSLLSAWLKGKEKECLCVAKDVSDDVEIQSNVVGSLYGEYKLLEETNVFLYDAIFIMVYSYYESVILKISKKYGCNSKPCCICSCNHIQLSNEANGYTHSLYNEMRILRNQFCHNYLGTFGSQNSNDIPVLENLKQQYSDSVFFDDTSVHILKKEFISVVLKKECFVINELVQKLNL